MFGETKISRFMNIICFSRQRSAFNFKIQEGNNKTRLMFKIEVTVHSSGKF